MSEPAELGEGYQGFGLSPSAFAGCKQGARRKVELLLAHKSMKGQDFATCPLIAFQSVGSLGK